jgi:3-oxoacyl-[acyl-carrier-protein] synthase II
MHRIFDRGPRVASPAEFPNLVPSAPVGHVSIYLGLRGPSFMTADLSTSGESAFHQALELVATAEAPSIVAGAVEARSAIVEDVLAGMFASRGHYGSHRPEIAAALVVESRGAAELRRARVLASVEQWIEWRREGERSIARLMAPHGPCAEIVLPRPSDTLEGLLAASPWNSCRRTVLGGLDGESDAFGAVALAMAVGRLAMGRTDEVLVIGIAKERGYAVVLRRD